MSQTIRLNDPRSIRTFRRNLLNWYRIHQRPLPWRKTSDPYQIWVSEIMLQQTRVNAVLEHYQRFLERYPTVSHLAKADEAEVLSVWSGLGYYRRARMLHRAAKVVVAVRSGRIPQSAAELRTLPGIGRYTANAIASIAFGEAAAVVDGNVERVLARLLRSTVSGERVWSTAQALLDPESPGDFNEAMMELGATICVPGVPLCHGCPISKQCGSRGMARDKASVPEKRFQRSSSVLLVRRRGSLLLQQRAGDERLMPGMWELPAARSEISREPLLRVKHSITTSDWRVSVFPGSKSETTEGTRWVPLGGVSLLPLTGLTRKILQKLELLS